MLFVLLPTLVLRDAAAAQQHAWSELLGSARNDTGQAVAIDGGGNVVVTGTFEGSGNLAGVPVRSAGQTDIFLAKFSSEGALLWLLQVGGPADDRPTSVAVDGGGNVIIAGRFSGTADFGRAVLGGAGGTDGFVAKFSATGNPLWALGFGCPFNDTVAGVAVDGQSNVVLLGQFAGAIGIGRASLVSAGSTDLFLAKFSAAGSPLWSRRVGASRTESPGGIAVDRVHDQVVITGAFDTATDLGGGSLLGSGLYDVFAAGYAGADGAYRWASAMGGTGYDAGSAIAADVTGDLLVTGYFGLFGGPAACGPTPLSSAGGADVFLLKLDGGNGSCLWAKHYGGARDDYGRALAVDRSGNIAVTGEFQGEADFGGAVLASAGQFDAFVARFSPFGGHLWSKQFGDIVTDKGTGIAVDANGDVAVTGFTLYRVDFGGGSLLSAGFSDAFLAKLGAAAPLPTPTLTFTPTSIPPTRTATLTATSNVPPTATATRPAPLTQIPTALVTSTRTRTATTAPTRTRTRTPTISPITTRTRAPTDTPTVRRPPTPTRTPMNIYPWWPWLQYWFRPAPTSTWTPTPTPTSDLTSRPTPPRTPTRTPIPWYPWWPWRPR